MPVLLFERVRALKKKNGPSRSVFRAALLRYFFDLLAELLSLSEPVLPLNPVALDPLEPKLPAPPEPELPLEPELALGLELPLPPELACDPELPVSDDEPDFDALRLLRQSLNSSENLR